MLDEYNDKKPQSVTFCGGAAKCLEYLDSYNPLKHLTFEVKAINKALHTTSYSHERSIMHY